MKLRSLILLGLALTMGVTAVQARKKKSKKTVVETLKPVAAEDFSYAIGVAQTASLRQYVEQQHRVDQSQIENFILGMKGQHTEAEIAKMRAIVTGADVFKQITQQNVPAINKQATGKEDTTYVKADVLLKGIEMALRNQATLTPDSAAKVVEAQFKYQSEKVKTTNQNFLEKYKKQAGVKSTPSGLLYKVVKMGNGALPADTSKVKVNYEGRLIDGTVFDSSYKRGEPATFALNQVIKGWTEALQLMPVGSEFELCLPYDLAYGERGSYSIPPFATLVFKVELLGIEQ